MAVSIFGYSGAYLQNPNAKSVTQGAQGSGPTGAAIQIYEPKLNWPEKAGDAPFEAIPVTIPTTRFDGTALAVGDLFYFAPLGNNVKVTAMTLNITAAAGGTLTMNVGNNTSATAYYSGANLAATSATAVTTVTLNAAAAGSGANDAIVGAVASTSSPTGSVTATLNVQYGVATVF